MQAISRGDIFYADLSPVVGCEQGGTRPVLVLQNDTGNLSLIHILYLCDRAGKSADCWPAVKTIAADLQLSRSTVKRALHDLCLLYTSRCV